MNLSRKKNEFFQKRGEFFRYQIQLIPKIIRIWHLSFGLNFIFIGSYILTRTSVPHISVLALFFIKECLVIVAFSFFGCPFYRGTAKTWG